MNLSVSPVSLSGVSYTKSGNEYKKCNIGKAVAMSLVAADALILGAGIAYKAVKGKSVKMPKIETLKSAFKGVKENVVKFFKEFKFETLKSKAENVRMKVCQLFEEHSVTAHKAVKFAIGAPLIILAGMGIDAIVNKINSKKADKQ